MALSDSNKYCRILWRGYFLTPCRCLQWSGYCLLIEVCVGSFFSKTRKGYFLDIFFIFPRGLQSYPDEFFNLPIVSFLFIAMADVLHKMLFVPFKECPVLHFILILPSSYNPPEMERLFEKSIIKTWSEAWNQGMLTKWKGKWTPVRLLFF